MKKNDVRIKKQLSLSEKVAIINITADSYFTVNDKTNEVLYTPYYKEIGLITAFGMRALEGVTFDEDEDIYSAIINDYTQLGEVSLYDMYLSWLDDNKDLLIDVKDVVEFKKAKLLQSTSESEEVFRSINEISYSVNKVANLINQVLETANSKLAELDVKILEKIAKKLNVKELVKAYQSSGIGDGIRDAEIAKLAKENKELKNQITARNIKVQ